MTNAIVWLIDYVKALYGSLITDAAKEALTLLIPIIIDLVEKDGEWSETTRARAQRLVLATLRDAGLLRGLSSE